MLLSLTFVLFMLIISWSDGRKLEIDSLNIANPEYEKLVTHGLFLPRDRSHSYKRRLEPAPGLQPPDSKDFSSPDSEDFHDASDIDMDEDVKAAEKDFDENELSDANLSEMSSVDPMVAFQSITLDKTEKQEAATILKRKKIDVCTKAVAKIKPTKAQLKDAGNFVWKVYYKPMIIKYAVNLALVSMGLTAPPIGLVFCISLSKVIVDQVIIDLFFKGAVNTISTTLSSNKAIQAEVNALKVEKSSDACPNTPNLRKEVEEQRKRLTIAQASEKFVDGTLITFSAQLALHGVKSVVKTIGQEVGVPAVVTNAAVACLAPIPGIVAESYSFFHRIAKASAKHLIKKSSTMYSNKKQEVASELSKLKDDEFTNEKCPKVPKLKEAVDPIIAELNKDNMKKKARAVCKYGWKAGWTKVAWGLMEGGICAAATAA